MGKRSIIKERFSKKYRHPSLDSKLTLKRLNAVRCFLFPTQIFPFFFFTCCIKNQWGFVIFCFCLEQEARCTTKARKLGVSTPVLYAVDPLLHTLTFEYVEGPSVKDTFLEFGSNGVVQERLDDIATQIGDAVAKLHDGGLVHGDLTTSNMLIRNGTNQLVSFFFFFIVN